MKRENTILASLSVAVLLVILTASFAVGQDVTSFKTIDYPQASLTVCNEINKAGVIAGYYADSVGVEHAFTLIGHKFTVFDPPGSTGTEAWGINDAGDVVGFYVDSVGATHGFVLKNGQYTTVDYPNSTLTELEGINNAGLIAGTYIDPSTGIQHGLSYDGTTITTIDPPGATVTNAIGINNLGLGVISGLYLDSANAQHGFTLNRGTYRTVDFPGGSSVSTIDRVNDAGDMAGLFEKGSSQIHGLFQKNRVFHAVNIPKSVETRCRGMNNADIIVGRYTDANGVVHGFVLQPGQ